MMRYNTLLPWSETLNHRVPRLVLILLFAVFLSTSLAARMITYQGEADFTFQYPDAWKISVVNAADSLLGQEFLLVGTRETGSGFENRLDLVINPSQIPLTAESVGNLEQYYLQEASQFADVNIEDIAVSQGREGSREFILGRYTAALPGWEEKIITEQYYVPGAERTFILTFTSSESDHRELSPEYKAMVGSLKDRREQVLGWASLPDWLQLVLIMVLVVGGYLIIRTIHTKWKRSREEVVIYRHDRDAEATYDSGNREERGYTKPGSDTDYGRDRPDTQPTGSDHSSTGYRVPESEPTPGPRKTPTIRKNGSWSIIIALIVVINILRQCLQNK